MTFTFADFINLLTLLLVTIILILLWRRGLRRSHQGDSVYRSTVSLPSVLDPAPPKSSAAVPDEFEQHNKTPKERWAGLTLHQRNIARLAAEGKQNGEIAQALHIRSSTVSTHMKSIYKTLEVHSRRELANFVQELEG